MKTPLVVLASALALSGCTDEYAFDAAATRSADGSVVLSWSGDPAREVRVYRCETPCPVPEAMPSYSDEPVPELAGARLVWHISTVTGVESGKGALGSPVVLGAAPPGSTELVALEASPVAPGSYLARVVQSEGNLFAASWGTAWAAFEVAP